MFSCKVRQAFRFRLDPSPAQAAALARVAGCARLAYNRAKALADAHYHETGRTLSIFAIKKRLPTWKGELPFLAEVPHHCLQEAILDFGVARQRCFDGVAAAPGWRRKFVDDGFRFPDPGQFHLDERSGRLILPKFGKTKGDGGPLAIRLHRPIKGRIRSITIRREGGHWFASLNVAVRLRPSRMRRPAPLSAPLRITGVDRNVTHPFVTTTVDAVGEAAVAFLGGAVETAGDQRRRRRLQQALARKKKGSANRRKARRALARHAARIGRRRRDRTHKASRRVVDGADVVALEALQVRAMTATARGTVDAPGRNVAQKAGLNGAILDRGWGEFRRQVAYKAQWAGKRVVEVTPAYTSQTCSCCGNVSPENRKGGMFRCVACGHQSQADANASDNIRTRALHALGLIVLPAGGRPVAACGALCAGRASKQEGEAARPAPPSDERGGGTR